jgi:hypothetical protein
MPDVPSTSERERSEPPQQGESAPGASEQDFLHHLYRGSELLAEDRLEEAKQELDQALQLQPQDAKSQDLLAGVHFRLGGHDRAIEIWSRLVEAYPKNAALRINLGLAQFKAHQTEAALGQFHAALRLEPGHERGWGYLGLVHWRLGQMQQARDAFLRGGQATMARRMQDALASSPEQAGDVPSDPERALSEQDASQAALRSAADEAIEQFDGDDLPLSVAHDEQATQGQWSPVEPGQEPVPQGGAELPSWGGATTPLPLATLVQKWAVPLSERAPLVVGPEGELFVHGQRDVYVRIAGLRAVGGDLRTSPVRRRMRGSELDESLGGDNPIFRWHGPTTAVIAAPEGVSFTAFDLGHEDLLYVREEFLWAFDDRVGFESGRLPLAGKTVVLTQLFGTGSVVLSLPARPKALSVQDGQEVRVEPDALIGWTGRLFPDTTTGTAPYALGAPPLAFRGEGTVLVS